jgi:uncharacterized protein with FMN-binding domain
MFSLLLYNGFSEEINDSPAFLYLKEGRMKGHLKFIIFVVLAVSVMAGDKPVVQGTRISKHDTAFAISFVKDQDTCIVLGNENNIRLCIKYTDPVPQDQETIQQPADGSRLTIADFKKSAPFPSWAKPIINTPQEGKPWQVSGGSRVSTSAMKQSTGRLRYVVDYCDTSIDYPFYLLQLGRHLTELNEDRTAYQVLETLTTLPEGTRHNSKLYGFPSLQSVKREGYFFYARLLARNGFRKEVLEEIALLSPKSGYDALRAAELMVMLDDRSASKKYLTMAHGPGHPERNFSDIFIRMRAVTLARAIGDNDLALDLAGPVLKKKMDSQKWPQWQSAWSIINSTAQNCRTGKLFDLNGVRDGLFKGSCRGFDDVIEVDVEIHNAKIKQIVVTKQKESRPWSVLDVVPERIVEKQVLGVDAVTGATVSSCAVIVAVDNAVMEAANKNPRNTRKKENGMVE